MRVSRRTATKVAYIGIVLSFLFHAAVACGLGYVFYLLIKALQKYVGI